MPAVRDAFTRGRSHFGGPAHPGVGPASGFQNGAAWVAWVLVPAIELGNAELEPEHVVFRLDLNLDPQSNHHAHADFWLAELDDGRRAQGLRYSINVIGGQSVWLYKPGEPGRALGTVGECDADLVGDLLRGAAEEFGEQIGSIEERQFTGAQHERH
ncbi:hypothetical protein [Bradyrhizobium sp. sGM-13]|uniref:hypothetical protein n=1 Tax=Bradyrhizobium sp. sGM-13 TaxID=2831781 RepID=UPI001BCB4796|nr:hypothetical protein [Bradyrhizobium sp. sGM-13]